MGGFPSGQRGQTVNLLRNASMVRIHLRPDVYKRQVYDEANEMMRSSDRVKYELPKNIRQVGNAPGNYKIYVEDYVMTYLRRIASPGNMNCRGAILLGKVYDENGTKVIFVSGAVDVYKRQTL